MTYSEITPSPRNSRQNPARLAFSASVSDKYRAAPRQPAAPPSGKAFSGMEPACRERSRNARDRRGLSEIDIPICNDLLNEIVVGLVDHAVMVDIRRKESGSGQRLLTAYVLQDCDLIGYLDLSVAVHVAEQHHEFCLVAASVGVAEGCEDHTGRALYGGIGYERSVSGVRADGISVDFLGCYERRKRGLCARDSREYGSAVVYGFRIAVGFAYGNRASLSYQAERRLRTERGRRDIDAQEIVYESG